MWQLVIAVSAIMPSVLIGLYFHYRDLYPEPPRVLWATFGLGVASIFAVLPVELGIGAAIAGVPGTFAQGALDAFLVASLPEEFVKLAVVMAYCYRHRAFDEPMDGIVYGVMAALGFATLENVMYVFDGNLATAIMRAFTAVPSHATEGAIMGYFVGQARFAARGKAGILLSGFIVVVLLHGSYDFPLLSMTAASKAAGESGEVPGAVLATLPITLVALAISIVTAIILTRRLRRGQLQLAASAPAWPFAPAPWPPPPLDIGARVPPPAQPQAYQPAPPSAPPLAWPPPPLDIGARVPPPAQPQAYQPAPAPAPGRLLAVVLIVLGSLAAGAGGMIVLALMLAFAIGQVESNEAVSVILGGIIIGVAPLIVGLIMFILGILRLNRAAPRPFPYRPAPYPYAR
jgi:protease PrsW